MKKSNNNKISADLKSQVMIELAKGELGVRNISMRYGVSRANGMDLPDLQNEKQMLIF